MGSKYLRNVGVSQKAPSTCCGSAFYEAMQLIVPTCYTIYYNTPGIGSGSS